MKVEELLPKPECCDAFRRDRLHSLPQSSGCYVLSTATNEILYTGLAVNVRQRIDQHLANPQKTSPTISGKAMLVWWYESDQINALERGWLNQYRIRYGKLPILNQLDSPVTC